MQEKDICRERMGRQNKDTAIVGSSLVLLQERFKQLQRLKEMREETQMLNLMPQEADQRHELSDTRYPTTTSNGASYLQDPLSLGLNSTSHSHHTTSFRHINPQQLPAVVRGPYKFFDVPDVDTSLRL